MQSFSLAIREKNGNAAVFVFILHNVDLKVFGIDFIIPSSALLLQSFKTMRATIH